MQSKKILSNLILVIMSTFFAVVSSYASVAEVDSWQNFGNKVVYFLGSDRCPTPSWLRRRQQMELAFAKLDYSEGVLAVASFLEQALEGYELESLAWQGRIPLNENPGCILGLYLAEKFPGTKVGDWASRLFSQSVEHSCLVELGAGASWKTRLETGLMKIDENSTDGVALDFLDTEEWPFLLIYFTQNGSSEQMRLRSRRLFAKYRCERYGLVSALTQYRLLLLGQEYSGLNEDMQLQIARLFEQTGAIFDAQELYEKILKNTNVAKIATTAAESLAQLKLADSQQADAWQSLGILRKRFPDVELTSESLQSFSLDFQTNREKKIAQLISKLITAQKQEEILKLCRDCSGLWTEKEALGRWQYVIKNVESESLPWQYARLYLAQNMVNTEKFNEAKDIIGALVSSSHPAIRARALFISADIAQSQNKASEAVTLYQQVAQIERPTTLPQWLKTSQIKQTKAERLTAKELNFFALFLRGYNEIIDGNFSSGVANLLKARETRTKSLQKSLYYHAKKAIPSMLMLAYLKMGDYARAEQYGFQAIKGLGEDGQDSKQFSNILSQIENADNSLAELSRQLHTTSEQGSKYRLETYANLYTALTAQGTFSTDFAASLGLVQLFWHIKCRQVSRFLSAEYGIATRQLTAPNNFKEFLNFEPLVFMAQLLREDSFEQIRKALAAAVPREYAKGQMYRFAKFAEQVRHPYMARMALDAAVQQIDSASGNVQLLEDIAKMYLRCNNYQKAIEIYERIVEQVSDSNEVEQAKLKIIDIYAEQLRLYDRAILECQRFLKKFADSPKAAQIELLIGKLAYLDKDYAGAVGQLDLFQRKYPDSPKVSEAMMLAAISRMSEGNTRDATDRFTEIIQKYPKGELAARSKFLIGYSQVSEQKYSQALETFRQLIEQFPKSEYREQAQNLIHRLSKISR